MVNPMGHKRKNNDMLNQHFISQNQGSALVGMLLNAALASCADLRHRVANVRYAPMATAVEKNCDCINFDFDAETYLGELRGRNRDLCIDTRNPEAEANRAIAVRVLLDRNASLLKKEQTSA